MRTTIRLVAGFEKWHFSGRGVEAAAAPANSPDMEKALIIGSSGAIGTAMSEALVTRGVAVTGLSRRDHGLDVTDEASVDHHLGGLDGPFDMIFVATGALEVDGQGPEKSLRDVTARNLQDQFLVNCVGPALVLRHAPRLLPRDRRCVFAALSARVGSIGDNGFGGWYAYRTAKAALNQMLHTGAIELSRRHSESICVALHPGTVVSPLTEKYLGNHPAVPPEEAATNLLHVIDGLMPEDTGRFFDWQGERVPW